MAEIVGIVEGNGLWCSLSSLVFPFWSPSPGYLSTSCSPIFAWEQHRIPCSSSFLGWGIAQPILDWEKP